MSRKPAETLTDYLVAAISPALIMLLVGSLVFFLMHVFYEGEFPGKLRFASAMFVLAAVLIARISIEEGREYASMFALPLSVVTILSMMRYTDAGLFVVLPLVIFIWWSTDKLTWDCTVIDERKDASGEGLLQTVGLDSGGAEDAPSDIQNQQLLDREATTDSPTSAKKKPSLRQQWIERRRRHHKPGVWVMYFGVAAVPLFGLGQWLLPAAARGSAFLLLCVYVASTLALLMTTSFLQMRRYLMQRRLSLPEETATTWLVTGGVMIAVLMVVCLMLPRPNTGYSLLDSIGHLDSRHDQRASRFGLGDEGVSDPEQNGQAPTANKDAAADSEFGQQPSHDAEQENKPGGQGRTPDDEESASCKSASDTGSDSQNGGSSSQDDGDTRSEGSADQQQNDSKSNRQRNSRNQPRQEAEDAERKSLLQRRAEPQPDAPRPSTPPPNLLQNISLGNLMKWIYFVLIGLLVAFVLFRYWKEIRDAIRAFLRDLGELWRRLFGGRRATRSTAEERPVIAASPTRPFSSFQDPFAAGWAGRLSPQQLVSYTFDALQAWAEEQNCGRQSEQTPLEFAAQVANSDKQVGAPARNLAILYNQAAYAPGILGDEAVDHARRLWSALRAPTAVR